MTTARYGCRLSALRTGRLYPQEYSWYSFSLRAESEGNMSLKNPVTPPGIDPGTVRLVAQRLKHYATPGPLSVCTLGYYIYVCVYMCILKHTLRKDDRKYLESSGIWWNDRVRNEEVHRVKEERNILHAVKMNEH